MGTAEQNQFSENESEWTSFSELKVNWKKLAAVWTCQPGRPWCQIHVTDPETRQRSLNSSLEGLARKPDAASGRLSSVVGHLGSALSIYRGKRWWQVAAHRCPSKKCCLEVWEMHTQACGDFDMALAFKDTVEGCSIPLALQAESNTARESREEEQEDCHSSTEAPVTIRGFSFFRGFYLSVWGDTWSQLGELTEGQCLSRLYPGHGLLPGKQGWVLVLAGEHSVCRETGNQVTWGLGDFFFSSFHFEVYCLWCTA